MTVDPITRAERAELFACLESVNHAGLAVSGGADSMALMHLAALWRTETGRKAPDLTVLTVDHGLRRESGKEAQWVERVAGKLGLPCIVLRWNSGQLTSRIQERAREARYDLMAAHAHSEGLDALVTAHHLEDQAETVLMRLARGSGPDGLAAMPERGRWAGLDLLRPFLDMPKERLVATLKSLGAGWLEDPSNDDTRFERVRLRALLGELAGHGITANALAQTAKRQRRASQALERVTDEFIENNGKLDDAGYCRLVLDAFLKAPEEIALRAMSRALQTVSGEPSPPRLAKLESLVANLRGEGEMVQTLGGCRVVSGPDDILVHREAGRANLESLILQPGESGLWDNRYHVSSSPEAGEPVEVRALGAKGYGEIREKLGNSRSLPEHVADSLVSFWRDDALLAVPPLEYAASLAFEKQFSAEMVTRTQFFELR